MKRSTTAARLAWDKKLGSALPLSPTGESGWIRIPGAIPSKANEHAIHFAPGFWRLIQPLVESWRRLRRASPYWVSPRDEVKVFEAAAAQLIAAQATYRFEGTLAVELRFFGQRADVDNTQKALLDSLQKARLIKNDNQIVKLTVEKFLGEESYIEMKVRTYAQRTTP